MNPFEFVNSICDKGTHFSHFNRYYDSAYKPFIVNRHLSFFPDTIFLAQDMNVNWHLPHKMQYEYYFNSVRSKKRFKKWPPTKKAPEDVKIVQDYYKINTRRAREYLDLMSIDDLLEIKRRLDTGGEEQVKKNRK